jgi:hypothetical protein
MNNDNNFAASDSKQLAADIAAIKKILENQQSPLPTWVPRKEVMNFFDYGETSMATLEKSGEIIVSRIGRRTFINRNSLEEFLNRNSVRKNT